MIRVTRLLLLTVLATLVVAPDICAQRALSLADAQTEARANAPEIAELQARIAGAEAIAVQAGRRVRDDPTLSTSVFRGALVGHPDESAWNLALRQPVDFSGSWKPRAASAAADVERTGFERANGLRLLDERVAMAFADVALAQRQLARGEQIAELARLAAQAVHRQLDVGTAAELDADSADLDLAGTRVPVEQTRGDLERARIALARLLGRDSATGLIVDDGEEPLDVPPAMPDVTTLIDRDPRVLAAIAEVTAAGFERQMFERLVTPAWTFGVDVSRKRSDIPTGAFTGAPFASALTANWSDSDVVFSASVPLPLFNRQREPRARATARGLAAEARVRAVRADVRSELESAWASLQAAIRGLQSATGMSAIIERDMGYVEQAVQAGQFDATTRATMLRRLRESGRLLDIAVRDVRVARAAWLRRVSGVP